MNTHRSHLPTVIFALAALCLTAGCEGGNLSTKDLKSFVFLAADNVDLPADVAGVVDGPRVAVTVAHGTDRSALVPTIVTTGESVRPASGRARDFTEPVIYTVTAADGTSERYTVTVSQAPDSAKDITRFAFAGLRVEGTINGGDISLTVPAGTAVRALAPTIAITGERVAPISGRAVDFTRPVAYTVSAGDGSTRVYTVTVRVAAAGRLLPVGLGLAGAHVILAKSAISTVPPSRVTGHIALSPAAASFITGFALVADASNVFATSPQVVGRVFAADYANPTPNNLTTAVGSMEAAYTDAAGRPTPDFLELGTGAIGGLTLAPGLYNWTSTVAIGDDVTFRGSAEDVWILQTSGDLVMASDMRVELRGGALARNIFWQVAGQVVVGTGAHFEGVLLCMTDVTMETGATMNGRILAQTQVALQQATISEPAP